MSLRRVRNSFSSILWVISIQSQFLCGWFGTAFSCWLQRMVLELPLSNPQWALFAGNRRAKVGQWISRAAHFHFHYSILSGVCSISLIDLWNSFRELCFVSDDFEGSHSIIYNDFFFVWIRAVFFARALAESPQHQIPPPHYPIPLLSLTDYTLTIPTLPTIWFSSAIFSPVIFAISCSLFVSSTFYCRFLSIAAVRFTSDVSRLVLLTRIH
jgi:hypothetical protein